MKSKLLTEQTTAATGFNGFADVVNTLADAQFIDGEGTGGGSVYESAYMVRVNGSNNGLAPVVNYNIEVGVTIVQNGDPGDGLNQPHVLYTYHGLYRAANW